MKPISDDLNELLHLVIKGVNFMEAWKKEVCNKVDDIIKKDGEDDTTKSKENSTGDNSGVHDNKGT